MKRLLLLLCLLFAFTAHSQNSKLIASCCDAPKEAKSFGRCSGDAYCTACSNCKYCKNCSQQGGSCGVCTTYAAPKKTSAKKKSSTSTAAKLPSQYYENQNLVVTSATLNAREGAGTEYDVVETLHDGDNLKFISYEGDWIYVYINGSGAHGYVYYKYVR